MAAFRAAEGNRMTAPHPKPRITPAPFPIPPAPREHTRAATLAPRDRTHDGIAFMSDARTSYHKPAPDVAADVCDMMGGDA